MMKTVYFGNQTLTIKDYYCSSDTGYYPRTDEKLWLYVVLTDICNGHCPFCINPSRKSGTSPFDIDAFRKTIHLIRDRVCGISLTGGEPMLKPQLVDDVAGVLQNTFEGEVEIDLVTNGVGFSCIPRLSHLSSFGSIHLSRHRLTNEENDRLFGFHTVTWEEMQNTIAVLDDPGAVVLNCVLMKDGIETTEELAEYLERAFFAGVRNVSFIGMSKCNLFCEEHYVNPFDLRLEENSRFHIWSRYHDQDFCGCLSGSYETDACSIRFYMRGMGNRNVPFTRQLVYTEDNRLLAGFGGETISFS